MGGPPEWAGHWKNGRPLGGPPRKGWATVKLAVPELL